MNVLSLFDGISSGQLALNRAGIKYDTYYASEIDKHAIKITQNNYPNTIQIGDIRNVKGNDLPKIDILIGGSPCQGFSLAGKQLNFNDERSRLFFEYVRVLNECSPRYFILENVIMKKQYQDIITKLLGFEPIEINSSLVSAQNRKRLYWTNIKNITLPNDKQILLTDILDNDVDAKYILERNIELEKRQKQNKINRHIITEKVCVRKYDVDISALKELLIKSKIFF
jgi:DNA (cytosine-5)-methyltransferase 3A